jgi:hypothetical protein
MDAPAARISLTRTQRTSQIGAELLSLCQTVTADGSLNDEEVSSLREWLTAHAASDLPAIRFLAPIVERILADGVVNTEERRELYLAVEKVLPPDARGLARAARMASEWTGRQDQEGPHRQHTPNSRSCCRSFQARREGRAIDSRCGAACEAFRPRDSPVGARGYRCSSHGATGMLLGIGKSGLLTKPTFSLWALRASAYEGGEPALSTLSCRSMWSGSRPESRQPPDV